MASYSVSRHQGAVDWAQRRGHNATLVSHLDPSTLQQGDIVLGTLPIHMVADFTARGIRYFHLEIDIPEARRGTPLTADDMERHGATLVEYQAYRRSFS